MRSDVARDLQKSSHDTARDTLPTLINNCPEFRCDGFGLVEGEHSTDHLRKRLDTLAGIDAYICWLKGMQGIAVRNQYGKNWRTFTIRLRRPNETITEYEKRLYTIEHKDEGFLFPYWTVQAYFTEPGGKLLSVGVAKTEELYLYVQRRELGGWRFPRRFAGNGGEEFLYVRWDAYNISSKRYFLNSLTN